MDLPRGMKDFDSNEMTKIEFVRQNFWKLQKFLGLN